MTVPPGRVSLALGANTLDATPDWTDLDATPHMVVSYQIDRGRQYELDQTNAATATVQINDPQGVLDPSNSSSPYYTDTLPLTQARLQLWDPVTETFECRFRGWVSDWDYTPDPYVQTNRLTLQLTDIFEILGAVEMVPWRPDGYGFGDEPPLLEQVGQVYFLGVDVHERITQCLTESGIPSEMYVVFSGNAKLFASVYTPGETPLTAIQEAANAEFPTVSNVYTDRYGRLVFHGRYAKFHPDDVSAAAGDTAWDWHHWHAKDGAALLADPGSGPHIRAFAFNLGVSKIINKAISYPVGADDSDLPSTLVFSGPSITKYGVRSWSAPNLITRGNTADSNDALAECNRFAIYMVENYQNPLYRVTQITFKSMAPHVTNATINWAFLSNVDIADQVDVTLADAGGGGFTEQAYFVEGIHETVSPLGADYDLVETSLDLSPVAYFTTNPFDDDTDPFA